MQIEKVVFFTVLAMIAVLTVFGLAGDDPPKITPQERASSQTKFWLDESTVSTICIDGVTYLFFNSDRRAGLTFKPDKTGAPIECSSDIVIKE